MPMCPELKESFWSSSRWISVEIWEILTSNNSQVFWLLCYNLNSGKGEIFQVLIEIDSLKTSKSRLVGLEMEFQQGSFWQGPTIEILRIAAWFRVSTSAQFVRGADSADDRLLNCN